MSEVQIVDLPCKKARNKFHPFFDAALSMPRGKAVLIDVPNVKGLYASINNGILGRDLRGKIAARQIDGKIYLIHAEDK